MVVSPGNNASYISLTLNPSSSATGSETVTFNATASNGLTVKISPSSVKLSAGFPAAEAVTVFASASATPGNFTVSVAATSGTFSASVPLPVRVVQNLVYLQSFEFSPTSLTVKSGSTVYFYNADPPHTWCGVYDSGAKTLMFTSVISTTSPAINSYSIWSITLTTPGTYTYMDTLHTSAGNATIIVTA